MKMFQLQKIIRAFFLTALLQIIVGFAFGQQFKYHTKDDLNLVISGTSTLHDWEMKGSKGEVNGTFTFSAVGQIIALNSLSFSTPSESIKSEHSAMDKNAYKALKSDKNPVITYTLVSATVSPVNATDFAVKCIGKLTIAGVTRDADLVVTCKLNADKSISVSGSKKISMKEFNMEPPTFMMGTIKTGNDVVLKLNLTIRK